MISGVTFLDRYEHPAARIANLSARDKFCVNGRSVIGGFDDAGFESDRAINGSWAEQFYIEFSSDRARRLVFAALLHQMMCRRPI